MKTKEAKATKPKETVEEIMNRLEPKTIKLFGLVQEIKERKTGYFKKI